MNEMKTVRVITISREYGSGGAAIGQELARRLGWKLLDRDLILELARRAHVPPSEVSQMDEHVSSFIERVLKAYWLGNTYVWSGPAPEVVDSDYLAELTAIVIREAGKLGQCVIVGRGAQCVLQKREMCSTSSCTVPGRKNSSASKLATLPTLSARPRWTNSTALARRIFAGTTSATGRTDTSTT